MDVSAYILAGGKSSRFGSDKARAVLDDKPLIVHIFEMLRSVCPEVVAVADVAAKYDDLGVPTIADQRPGLGPLGGVEAALADRLARHGAGWTIVASCDLAGLKREWVETIARHLSSDTKAVAFREDFWQPFPAAYHTDLLPIASQLLDENRASFQRLLSDERTRTEALPLPTDWPTIPQINTQEDLESFLLNRQDAKIAKESP